MMVRGVDVGMNRGAKATTTDEDQIVCSQQIYRDGKRGGVCGWTFQSQTREYTFVGVM
jgi:hypothetical protein